MRTKTIIDGFRNSQKFRVILNGVMINGITPKDLNSSKFGLRDQQAAVWQAINSLAVMRRVEVTKPIGLTGNWSGCEVQVDLI